MLSLIPQFSHLKEYFRTYDMLIFDDLNYKHIYLPYDRKQAGLSIFCQRLRAIRCTPHNSTTDRPNHKEGHAVLLPV